MEYRSLRVSDVALLVEELEKLTVRVVSLCNFATKIRDEYLHPHSPDKPEKG